MSALAQLYTISIAILLPVMAAAIAAYLARRAPAGLTALIWRATTMAIGVIIVGQLLALQSLTAVVPQIVAVPLVVLGKLQLTMAPTGGTQPAGVDGWEAVAVRTMLMVILGGMLLAALRLLGASIATRRLVSSGSEVRDAGWLEALDDARSASGVRGEVALRVAGVSVPMTCGITRPTILLPARMLALSGEGRRALLLHELAHVRALDLIFTAIARISCVVLWFHPAAWWVAGRLREACERAADDRVLATGVRASDYASLLVGAQRAAMLGGRAMPPLAALALDGAGGGMRARLTAILDTRRSLHAPARATVACATVLALGVSTPAATTRLAPSRGVLTSLMRDARWESRAYAAIGLAQRADSVDVAREVAERDPSPQVRAWARLALSGAPVDSTRVPRPRPLGADRTIRG